MCSNEYVRLGLMKRKKEDGVTENRCTFVEKSVIYQRSISRLNAKDIETRY